MIDIDLHIHSAYSSDGEFDVRSLADKCSARGLNTFSITDHNSVKANEEAAEKAREAGMGFIPGIEIDCNFRGTDLHLLGYGIDWRSPDFGRLEEDIRRKVMGSFGGMIDNLCRLGFVVDGEAVLAAAGDNLPTGELIAEVMLSDPQYDAPPLTPYAVGGSRSDMPYINFYLDYFAQGKPAFVPVEYMNYREAVELIRDNGGIPVVAHPGLNFRGRERIAEQLLARGAAGLEVFNNYHTPEQIAFFAPLVQQQNALMTCGSDFHGKTKPLIGIGEFRFDDRCARYLCDSVGRLNVVRA